MKHTGHRLRIAALLTAGALIAVMSGCGGSATTAGGSSTGTNAVTGGSAAQTAEDVPGDTASTPEIPDKTENITSAADISGAENLITFTDGGAEVRGTGVTCDGTHVTISRGGSYTLTGSCADGSVTVAPAQKEEVTLILSGLDLTSASYSPLCAEGAEKLTVILADGTQNSLTDGASYSADSTDETDAALFTDSDLILSGSGELTVRGNYACGIKSKDALEVLGGVYNITSASHALVGRDTVTVSGGDFRISAGGDGVKTTNDTESDKGAVTILGGTFNIEAAQDGIQAQTVLTVADGVLNVKTGGGAGEISTSGGGFGDSFNPFASSSAQSDDSESAKGIKGGTAVSVTGGSIALDCADDAVHSNGTVTLGGGELTIATGDDGIHADSSVTISGGVTVISQSYEGIEGMEITISGGDVTVTASDDGVNASDGSGSGGFAGFGGMGSTSSSCRLVVSGGILRVNSGGDGVDSNGVMEMTGGEVYVDGPTDNGNGAIDSGNGFAISGGILVAVGSSGMAETPDSSSRQCSIAVNTASCPAGTVITLLGADGSELLSFTAAKTFQSAVISSPAIVSGGTYSVAFDGTEAGSVTVTVSSSLSSIGSSSGMGGGAFPGGGDFPGGGGGRR